MDAVPRSASSSWLHPLRDLARDLRFAVRNLGRRPGFTAAVAGVSGAMAGLAAYGPARRALRVDPVAALRAE